MNQERERLRHGVWKKWGPYVSDRQWGTVREDYSENGDAWHYSTHDMARSKAYRWGEEGIGGISDDRQQLCFSLALWNHKDPILKEIFYGLANKEGNHGEDVKELYYYLDSTPTHSYMKMLYKYPQAPYPYQKLKDTNARRTREEPEYELMDTGVFDHDAYFDVFIEYAKAGPEDILVRITAHNRGRRAASLDLLPTLWFRNTWSWEEHSYKPGMGLGNGGIAVVHKDVGVKTCFFEEGGEALFCNNETNPHRLFGNDTPESFYKDGVHEHVVHGLPTVDPRRMGTKAALRYALYIPGRKSRTIRLRLSPRDLEAGAYDAFADFDEVFAARIREADDFYADLQQRVADEDHRLIQRQALGGILWNKQFYYYNVQQWLAGDPAKPKPPESRLSGRNYDWKHLHNDDIISMPDKWEYPWYANWDLAFQCVTLALVDLDFAQHQLELLTKDWYIHPNGKMPAYEWSFNDANPPVFAWATWEVYRMGKEAGGGRGDREFLEGMFHKLLVNFTWWVNRKDTRGHNIFEGGFLGLDNIGVFDRSMVLEDGILEQADATSWMTLFALNMLRISIELSHANKRYLDMSSKFFSHFLYMAGAIDIMGDGMSSLWDREDRFFYDQVRRFDMSTVRLKVRSMVGLIPLFAVDVIDRRALNSEPEFLRHVDWFLENRPDLLALVTRWAGEAFEDRHLLSLVRDRRLKSVLRRMLDEGEFLSPSGIRSLSKAHEEEPYLYAHTDRTFGVRYLPGESDNDMYGGNSNWRGPVWMPVNYMLVRSLHRFKDFYGDRLRVPHPTGSGEYHDLGEVARDLSLRLIGLFARDASGRRKVFGRREKFQTDPHFKDYILFHEYFHGETGEGLGASHQTGWTALVANLIQMHWDI
ncbi:MGH1-like glycoside hydrolase domain-containing protein [Dinghuibacter silviterrae]|uniref:Glycosyl hydrolase family 63 n=1 Tax=Dinghuibacter silviterrae TaxID=1539049 RepID=A0A4R8DUY3_9BACT|nr:glucosidase [Dinghuibacter silviterrae]TDX01728.1 glycosyl hydrolase family 63 [Dinghuibacter silviterrae]